MYMLNNSGGVWQEFDITWAAFLQRNDAKAIQVLFTTLEEFNATDLSIQPQVLEILRMPDFLRSRPYSELNSFCGRQIGAVQTNGSQESGYWCRFTIKQTGRYLRAKPSFERHDSSRPSINAGGVTGGIGRLHGPKSLDYGWEWYEMTFAVSRHASLGLVIVGFGIPLHLQAAIQLDLKQLVAEKQNQMLQSPHAALSMILHQLIPAYDRSVWSIRDHVCSWEAGRQTQTDYTLLHEISRHAIHVSESLEVATRSFKALLKQWDDLDPHFSANSPASRVATSDSLQLLVQVAENLLSRSEANKARVQNEISLAFHSAAQSDSKTQLRISENAQKEAVAVRNLSIVAVAFLPPTFICGIFSTAFFDFDASVANKQFLVSDQFWILWVTIFPVSVITMAIWWQYDKKQRRQMRW